MIDTSGTERRLVMSGRRVGTAAAAAVAAATLALPGSAVAAGTVPSTVRLTGPAAVAPSGALRTGALPQAGESIAWPVVRRGSTGQPVRSLQYLLRARGSALGVDGVFGARTDRAVRAFQRSHGLAVDGVVGPSTWTAVLVTVRRGSRGDAVRAVQDQFQFRNQSGDPSNGPRVDGVFGSDTEGHVRAFQGAVGLAADGVVGPRTWNQLIGGALSG
jgi:peptidoglycan hydrolase-like protein with peptidoglycan-binding domain